MLCRFLAILLTVAFLVTFTTPAQAQVQAKGLQKQSHEAEAQIIFEVLNEVETVTEAGTTVPNASAPPTAAQAATPPKTDFVDLQQLIPTLVLDIKYATADNFTHTRLYDNSRAFLRRGTAEKLKRAADEVAQNGYCLKIWDAYRSPETQFKMWSIVPDSRFIANPNKGYSNHSRGSAVDLTLVDLQGNEVPMPTGYDDFTVKAARTNQNANSKYLESVMVKYGFKPLATEWWHFDDQDRYPPAAASELPLEYRQKQAAQTVLNISAIGDVTLGQDERFPYPGSFNQYYDTYGADYFFSGVREILSKDDLTIANLEGALTKGTNKPDKSFQGNQAFFFKGDPSYVGILETGSIEAVNLANNHTQDYLEQGLTDTLAALNRSEIVSFGEGKIAEYQIDGVKIGLIGANVLGALEQGVDLPEFKARLADDIKKQKEKVSLVIVSFHWGTENKEEPDPEQRELARFAIDQGADLVVGHHPHVLQPLELYKGRYIIYSLGNFVFGGNSNPLYKETVIFQQSYTFANGQLSAISPPVRIPCILSSRYRPEPLPYISSKGFLFHYPKV